MCFRSVYQRWLNDPLIAQQDKDELLSIAQDDKEIEDRFYTSLQFGTAGLRGILGIGTNRMNRYVVSMTTQGYANYLKQHRPHDLHRGIAIAYDSRNKSEEFARITAAVLTGNGIKTYLFDTLHSVPQLSFTIGYLKCIGGVVITASHNPAVYNGYKVYSENGAQIPPDIAQAITEQIEQVTSLNMVKQIDLTEAQQQGILEIIGEAIDQAYYDYVTSLSINLKVLESAKQFRIVYTPLNGSGNVPVRKVLSLAGIENVFVVPEQEHPDGNFSTLEGPNPELHSSYKLAIALAKEKGADLILATDPDADRLGVAVVKPDGEIEILTGNQIASLILQYMLSQKQMLGTLPDNGLVVKSFVTTCMIDAITKYYGVTMHETLTGFRFIGEQVDECAKTHEHTFLFGCEESFGYLSGDKVRDKDAICAVLLIAEVAAYYAQRGLNLLDGLQEIYKQFGFYQERVENFVLPGKSGMEQIQSAMSHLRAHPPKTLGGSDVIFLRDYAKQTRFDFQNATQMPIDLPISDALYFELANSAWLCVRPSGTEPKLKVYASIKAKSAESAQQMLEELLADFDCITTPFLS